MGSISIRGIPDDVHRAIKARAKRNGRSAEAEVHDALARAYGRPTGEKGLGTTIHEIFADIDVPEEFFEALRRASTPSEPLTFD